MSGAIGIPNLSAPAVTPDGRLTEAWLTLIISLWNRTGGGTGQQFNFVAPSGEFVTSIIGSKITAGQVQLDQVAGQLTENQLPELPGLGLFCNPLGDPGVAEGITFGNFLDIGYGDSVGGFLTRGSEGWAVLLPGTASYVLTSAGPGQPLVWSPAGGGGQKYTDGTHTISGATTLTIAGGVISGSAPNAILTIPSGAWEITDGTNVVTGVTELTVAGGTVSGGSGLATLTVAGGGAPSLPGTSTLDPLDTTGTLSGGNLSFTGSGNVARSTIPRVYGKLYFEVTLTTYPGSGFFGFGIANSNASLSNYLGADLNSFGYSSQYNQIFTQNASGPGFTGSPIQGDVYGVEVDFTDRVISFTKNGGTPILSSAASPPGGWLLKEWMMAAVWVSSPGITLTINFGATSFVYGPPSGATAWG